MPSSPPFPSPLLQMASASAYLPRQPISMQVFEVFSQMVGWLSRHDVVTAQCIGGVGGLAAE